MAVRTIIITSTERKLPENAIAEVKSASLALRQSRLTDREDAWSFLRELWFSRKYSLDEVAFPAPNAMVKSTAVVR